MIDKPLPRFVVRVKSRPEEKPTVFIIWDSIANCFLSVEDYDFGVIQEDADFLNQLEHDKEN